MKVEGSHTFDAPREIVWPTLLDPDVLAKIMPGCEKLEQTGENEYEGIIKIKVGPVQGTFNGKVHLANINAPHSYDMLVTGKGPAGFVNGSGKLWLEGENGQTILHYTGDADVGGKIASVGQRLMDTSARAVIRQSLEGLGHQIAARQHAEDVHAPVPEIAAPTQAEFAVGVAQEMLRDFTSQEGGRTMLYAILGGVGVLLFLRGLVEWWTSRLARKIARKVALELKKQK
ncbi:MAG: carbon monoxide dehydrogenase subunit G [Chloroflexi bacterium]|nr:carbon monoxide dehydrogenase subunit G [Chloroflexota bacterium]